MDKCSLVMCINEVYNLGIEVNPVKAQFECDRSLNNKMKFDEVKRFNIPELKQQIQEMREFKLE